MCTYSQLCTVSGQRIVDIEIHSFVNERNAELREGSFCCCDLLDVCSEDLSNLPNCPFTCETKLTISLSECVECPGPCCATIESTNYINGTNISLRYTTQLQEKVQFHNHVKILLFTIVTLSSIMQTTFLYEIQPFYLCICLECLLFEVHVILQYVLDLRKV